MIRPYVVGFWRFDQRGVRWHHNTTGPDGKDDTLLFDAYTAEDALTQARVWLEANCAPTDKWTIRSVVPRPSEFALTVDQAIAVSRLIHDQCKDVPHDIGMQVAELLARSSGGGRDA